MRLALLTTWCLMAGAPAKAQGDFPTPEGSGLLVSGDFNDDGFDDVLVFGRELTGEARTYLVV